MIPNGMDREKSRSYAPVPSAEPESRNPEHAKRVGIMDQVSRVLIPDRIQTRFADGTGA